MNTQEGRSAASAFNGMPPIMDVEALRRLAKFPEQNPSPMLQVASDGTLSYANEPARNFLATLGWQPGAPLPAVVRTVAARARDHGHLTETEVEHPSGSIFWLGAVQPQGEDYVNIYGRNISARKRTEDALRESEAWLRLAQTAANAGAWEWDLRTNKNIWSDGLWQVYGLTPHSCKPSYETWRQTIHPDDRASVEIAVQDAARAGRELAIEWRVRDADGTERWLMLRGQALRDAAGAVARYIGIVMDITDLKVVEAELRATNKELKSHNRVMADHERRLIELKKEVNELCIQSGQPIRYR
ncbi:MAG: PAS domain-containing protein [Verrucomicrobia bacterium]|nr:PAS domain-containing protein [Verrucomicrobiota bacterium]